MLARPGNTLVPEPCGSIASVCSKRLFLGVTGPGSLTMTSSPHTHLLGVCKVWGGTTAVLREEG